MLDRRVAPSASYKVWLISEWTKRKRPTRSADSSSSEARPPPRAGRAARSRRSASRSSSSRSNDRPITAASVSRSRVSSPRRSTRRVITSRTLSGNPVGAERSTLHRSVAVVVQQAAGLDQAAKYLADEERVAVGLARDLLGEHEPVRVQLVAGRGRHHLGHLGRPEALERDPLTRRPAADLPARRRAGGPCRGPSRERRRSSGARTTRRCVTTCLSSATDCASAQCRSSSTTHTGTDAGSSTSRRRRPRRAGSARSPGRSSRGSGTSASRCGSVRARRASSPPCRSTCRRRSSERCVLRELGAHRDPRLVRHSELLRACAPQHGEPLAVCAVGGQRREAALADPRLSGDQHHLPRARARPALRDRSMTSRSASRPTNAARGDRAQQCRQRPAADADRLVCERRPRDGECLDRFGEPLQLELADGVETDAVEPSGEHPHGGRGQDAGRLAPCAQNRAASIDGIPK